MSNFISDDESNDNNDSADSLDELFNNDQNRHDAETLKAEIDILQKRLTDAPKRIRTLEEIGRS